MDNDTDLQSLLKDWQSENLEVRRRATTLLDKLNSWKAVHDCVSVVSCGERDPEPNQPAMPSESFIRESLREQLENDSSTMGTTQSSQIHQPLEINVTQEASFLKKHTLFHVGIRERAFKDFDGLFAFDGAKLIHLKGPHAAKNLAEILRSEATKLDQVEPTWLSDLILRALLPLSRLGYSLRGHFLAQPSTKLEQESAVTKPVVHASEDGGWILHFWSLFYWGGCTAKTPLLFEHKVVFSPEFEITFEPPDPELT
ncbi:MAG TPA: hypothetical protein V6C89_13125 [Drouetiella sp.]